MHSRRMFQCIDTKACGPALKKRAPSGTLEAPQQAAVRFHFVCEHKGIDQPISQVLQDKDPASLSLRVIHDTDRHFQLHAGPGTTPVRPPPYLLRPPTNAFSVCCSSLPATTTSSASGSNWNLQPHQQAGATGQIHIRTHMRWRCQAGLIETCLGWVRYTAIAGATSGIQLTSALIWLSFSKTLSPERVHTGSNVHRC